MANVVWSVCLVLVSVSACSATAALEEQKEDRAGKFLSLFQIVKFDNDVCTSNDRNGTCYTASECSTRGGTAGSSCGGGFGVCCIIVLECGDTSSDNNTYLIQSSVTSQTSECKYTICRCSTDICRIKFDFSTFVLASPQLGTTQATVASATKDGGSIGDCKTDDFQITSGNTPGTPTICGTNTGQHMIVDASSDQCHEVRINIGGSDTSTSRSWTIVVSQYTCGQEDLVGAPGCLQYHTASTGRIANFGVNTATTRTAVVAANTHLSNQYYNICVRRADGNCYICYYPTRIGGGAVTNQISFGLSVSNNAAAKTLAGTICSTDYIEIPNGQTATNAQTTNSILSSSNRFCGRGFSTSTAGVASAPALTGAAYTVCSRVNPFTVGVHLDADEQVSGDGNTALLNEQAIFPGGIIGFDLGYFQGSTNCV